MIVVAMRNHDGISRKAKTLVVAGQRLIPVTVPMIIGLYLYGTSAVVALTFDLVFH